VPWWGSFTTLVMFSLTFGGRVDHLSCRGRNLQPPWQIQPWCCDLCDCHWVKFITIVFVQQNQSFRVWNCTCMSTRQPWSCAAGIVELLLIVGLFIYDVETYPVVNPFSPTLYLIVAKMSLPKHSAAYWSNPPFSIFWHSGALALSRERQSARMSKN